MIRSRPRATYLIGALMLAPVAATGADAGEYSIGGGVNRIADRCTQFGPGYVDVGNGVCGQVSRSVRIYVPSRPATDPWTSGVTSSAAMRSDGSSMVPGAASAQHLRVRGNLDSYSPFR